MQNIAKQDLMQLIEFRQAVLNLRNNGLNEDRTGQGGFPPRVQSCLKLAPLRRRWSLTTITM